MDGAVEEITDLGHLRGLNSRLRSLSGTLTEFILANEVREADQGGVWLQYQSEEPGRTPSDMTAFGSAGPELYDGSAGISVGLLSSYLTEPSERLRAAITRTSRRSIQALTSANRPKPGMYTGLGGGIWALSALSRVNRTGEVVELREALLERWLPSVTVEEITAQGSKFDLIDGCAGVVISLRMLRKEPEVDSTRRLEEDLLEAIVSGAQWTSRGPCWPEEEDDPGLCSVSHGNSGVIAVLAGTDTELRKKLEIVTLLEAAIGYESSWLEALGTGWPDLRERLPETVDIPPPPDRVDLWCHGAPGIGLVRSHLREQGLGGEPIEREIEIARQAALAGLEEMMHSPPVPLGLCHGITGLAVIAKELGVPATPIFGQVVDFLEVALAEDNLGNNVAGLIGTDTFGLMTGLAGVLFGINCLLDNFSTPLLHPLAPWKLC